MLVEVRSKAVRLPPIEKMVGIAYAEFAEPIKKHNANLTYSKKTAATMVVIIVDGPQFPFTPVPFPVFFDFENNIDDIARTFDSALFVNFRHTCEENIVCAPELFR